MFGYTSRSVPVVARRWTPRRIRLAGLAAIVGALLVLVLPMTLLADPVGAALGVGPAIGLVMVAPLVAAVIAIGRQLRNEPSDTVPPAGTSA